MADRGGIVYPRKAAGLEAATIAEQNELVSALLDELAAQVMVLEPSDLMTYGDVLKVLHYEGLMPKCFILVTTEDRKDRLKEALVLGARGYVIKPFQPEGLRKILSLFVGESDRTRAEEGVGSMDF